MAERTMIRSTDLRVLQLEIRQTLHSLRSAGIHGEPYYLGLRLRPLSAPLNLRVRQRGWPVPGQRDAGGGQQVFLASSGTFFVPSSAGRSYHFIDPQRLSSHDLKAYIGAVQDMRASL